MKKIARKGLLGVLALGIALTAITTAIEATELNEDVMEASVSDNEMIPELAIGETYDGFTVKSVTVDKSEVVAGETLTLEIQVESEKELYDYACIQDVRLKNAHCDFFVNLDHKEDLDGKSLYVYKITLCTCGCKEGDITLDYIYFFGPDFYSTVTLTEPLAKVTTSDIQNYSATFEKIVVENKVPIDEEVPVKVYVTCSEAVKKLKNKEIMLGFSHFSQETNTTVGSYSGNLTDLDNDGVFEGTLKCTNNLIINNVIGEQRFSYITLDCGYGKEICEMDCSGSDTRFNDLTFEVGDDPDEIRNAKVKQFVSRMYTIVLNREAEAGGLDYWSQELLDQKQDGAALANGFINSEEFANRNLNDSDYLDVLYNTFFGRKADSDGKNYWLSEIKNGMSRNTVLAGFVNSKEFGAICESYGIARGTMENDGSSIYNAGVHDFVLRNYTKALGRDGEVEGVEYWSHLINTKQKSALDCAMDFFHSQEFKNKNLSDEDYVEVLYATYFGRESDETGKNYWLSMLASGNSRDWVLGEFAHSQEFKNIMDQYGL
ncbi:MAG: DUF4214 domain-containing protein [Lachnospiraceae bacterium]|nr:DUF4214 domain-containing protein [Lachnospiraceae bacterium]